MWTIVIHDQQDNELAKEYGTRGQAIELLELIKHKPVWGGKMYRLVDYIANLDLNLITAVVEVVGGE